MPLDPDFLRYPMLRKGMDHDLYPAANMFEQPGIAWPDSKPIALMVTVAVEFFPLTPNDGPFRAAGHMATPFPDLRTFTARDYGNRVAIYRIMDALAAADIAATAFVSSALIDRTPQLVQDIRTAGWEIAAHGKDMNSIHYGDMPLDLEQHQIESCLAAWSDHGVTPKGWMSPGRGQSEDTLGLLKRAGVEWTADWGNDDMPYAMNDGPVAMPYTDEMEDRKCITILGQNEDVWSRQVVGAADLLAKEAQSYGGRILHLALTPYIIGQPFRIKFLRDLLAELAGRDDIWSATGSEIHGCWRGQTA
ncbi:polysaccharide deacetylase family protein [uncultured Parasphingorhabdus sp.]|uniref:polysaccharide deacetylase family protein n=1 Tax=uncultured Parasphingorhabdus sp. TaxID=2709694 RepID=UPI002AA8E7DC|nr:polysaccharide deacetylase family protein [uncultured Parasphingorhabdus sp.]